MQSNRQHSLLAGQWNVYQNAHQDPRNLLIHVIAVPLFAAGVVGAALGLIRLAPRLAAPGALGMVLGFALQGIGHRFERNAPPPFASRAEFLARIFAEQFVTFPRFLLSGAWLRSLRRALKDRSIHHITKELS